MAGPADDAVVFEQDGLRLVIPKRYLSERRFPWVEQAEGFDEERPGAIVIIPGQEIREALGVTGEVGVVDPFTVVMNVSLPYESDIRGGEAFDDFVASEINQEAEESSEARVVFDSAAAGYRFYSGPENTGRWYFLRRKPPVTGADVVAMCNTGSLAELCGLSTFDVGRIEIEAGFGGGALRYSAEIKDYLTGLVKAWSSPQDAN